MNIIKTSLIKKINLFWMFLVAFLVTIVLILSHFGLILEDLQLYVFPIMVIALWKLPRDQTFHIPPQIVLIIISFGLLTALNIRGLIPSYSKTSSVYIARLDNDYLGLKARDLYRQFNEISTAYNLGSMRLLAKNFDNTRSARNWLQKQEEGTFLVTGGSSWVTVVTDPSDRWLVSSKTLEPQDSEEKQLTDYDLVAGENTRLIQLEDLGINLLLANAPEQYQLPVEPKDLSSNILVWLSDGLSSAAENAQSFAAKEDAFTQATTVVGPWKSNLGLGLSYFWLGTVELINHLSNPLDRGSLGCAHEAFGKSAGLIVRKTDPQSSAVMFNNAAIALLAQAGSKEDFDKSVLWLNLATKNYYKGQPVLGAKIALVNLILLQQSGLI